MELLNCILDSFDGMKAYTVTSIYVFLVFRIELFNLLARVSLRLFRGYLRILKN